MMPRHTKGIVDDANGHRLFPNFKMVSLGKEVAPHDVQKTHSLHAFLTRRRRFGTSTL